MRQQFFYLIGSILLIPLMPVLIWLGKRIRKTIPDLPEASEHKIGEIVGQNGTIELLTIGESTIAGVGVTDHRDGITGQLAQNLSLLTEKTVRWQILARAGYTAERVHQKLVSKIPEIPFDLIVIGLGGNDTFFFNSPLKFRKHLTVVIRDIRARQPQATIVIANMPPIGEFPAFPWLVKRVLGWLIGLHGAVIRDMPQQFTNVFYNDKKITLEEWLHKSKDFQSADDFFSDGVHPNAATYALWGKEMAQYIHALS